MADLFGLPDDPPAPRKAKLVLRLTGAPLVEPASKPAPAETGPRFGTREWDFCKCGSWASLHFPFLNGIRRCNACAKAEGLWTPSTPIWSSRS